MKNKLKILEQCQEICIEIQLYEHYISGLEKQRKQELKKPYIKRAISDEDFTENIENYKDLIEKNTIIYNKLVKKL